MHEDRKKVWVDEFQTRLFVRIVAYLVIYLFCLGNLLFIWRLLADGPGNPLYQYASVMADNAPALVCLAILMPIMAYDALRFSHRLVGPMVRFRKAMNAIAEGEPVRPIKLREDDFLTELRDDFNKMLEALQKRGVPVLEANDGADSVSDRKTA
jgi:hypothetical protein